MLIEVSAEAEIIFLNNHKQFLYITVINEMVEKQSINYKVTIDEDGILINDAKETNVKVQEPQIVARDSQDNTGLG